MENKTDTEIKLKDAYLHLNEKINEWKREIENIKKEITEPEIIIQSIDVNLRVIEEIPMDINEKKEIFWNLYYEVEKIEQTQYDFKSRRESEVIRFFNKMIENDILLFKEKIDKELLIKEILDKSNILTLHLSNLIVNIHNYVFPITENNYEKNDPPPLTEKEILEEQNKKFDKLLLELKKHTDFFKELEEKISEQEEKRIKARQQEKEYFKIIQEKRNLQDPDFEKKLIEKRKEILKKVLYPLKFIIISVMLKSSDILLSNNNYLISKFEKEKNIDKNNKPKFKIS